jgi:hypothetical protein
MADVMPGGRRESEYWECIIVCQVKEIKRSKPEMLIFVGEDSSQRMDITLFKNGVEVEVNVGDYLQCQARFKNNYKNFTANQIRKIDREEAEVFALECQEALERESLMQEAGLPANLQASYLTSDLYTNVERKPIQNLDEIEQKIFETLFLQWLDWGATHTDAQPNLWFNELMQTADLMRLVERTDDEATVRNLLLEAMDNFQNAGILRQVNKATEIDLDFFHTFTDRFLDRLHQMGPTELEANAVYREFNNFIPGNTKKQISFPSFHAYMQELMERRLLDFPNDPRNYRLKER